jgi:hypothetical protein
MVRKTIALAALVASICSATAATATAVAAPSTASAWQGSLYGDKRIGYQLQVSTQSGDQTAHSVAFAYASGAITITDSAGIVASPSASSGPEDDCVAIDPSTVRCPVDPQARLYEAVVDADLGAGDDLVDFRGLSKLPGHGPLESPDYGPGPAFPRAVTGPGNDVLLTGPAGTRSALGRGADVLQGGAGTDLVNGSLDADRLFGGAGRDDLWGGFGDDFLVGGPGRDLLSGDAGNDHLRSRDGFVDEITCGPGSRGKQGVRRDRRDHPFRSYLPYTSRLSCR